MKKQWNSFITSRGDSSKEFGAYLKIALFILGGGVSFALYMARLLFVPTHVNFGMVPSISIAAMAFTELGFAIVGVARTRDLLASAIKMVNLVSAFSSLVLTQVALLSFTQTSDLSYFNAIGGLLFGGLSILAAFYMLLKVLLHKRSWKQEHSVKDIE